MKKADLEKKVKNFFTANLSLKDEPEKILESFNSLVAKIEYSSLKKEECDTILGSAISAALLLFFPPKDSQSLCSFLEEVARIRVFHENIIDEKSRKKFVESVGQIDLESIDLRQKISLTKNLDFIGLEFPKMAKADDFLRKILTHFKDASYKKRDWVKNLAHTLAHSKNIGLLDGKKLTNDNKIILESLLKQLVGYVADNAVNTGMGVTDAGAALDVLLYCENVLGIKTSDREKVFLAKIAQVERRVTISGAQRSAFEKIGKFLENSSGRKEEWSHVPESSGKNIFIYGGKISLELEGALITAEGVVLRSGDIVIRNLSSGKILRVVEVDGPSHFISPVCKTSRTAARDALIRAKVGSDNFAVINLDSSGIFKFLTEETTPTAESISEANFLFGVRDFIQAEFAKDELAAAAVAQNVAEVKIVSKAVEAPRPIVKAEPEPVAPQRSKEDIEEELVQDFVLMLKGENAQGLEAILADPRFLVISPKRISQQLSGAEPFDFVLEKFNEKQQQNFLLTLQILWINGFQIKRKELVKAEIEYPQELRRALGLAKVEVTKEQSIDLRFLLQKVREGVFFAAVNLIKKRGLPDKLDEKNKRIILLILRISLQNLDRSIFDAVNSQTWFGVIEKELFVEALRAGDDVTVSFFIKNKKDNSDFFIKLFRSDDSLVKNIANLKIDKIANLLKEIIGKDPELAFKASDISRGAPRSYNAKDVLLNLVKKASRNSASGEEMNFIGFCYLKGSGAEYDPVRACDFFKRAADAGCKDAEINLVKAYKTMRQNSNAIETCQALIKKYPSDGEIYYEMSLLIPNEKERHSFLLEAARLEYPKSLGLVAVEYFSGMLGLPVDQDKAIEMATKAVALGDEESISNLGVFYLHRNSETKAEDERMAFYFFNQSFVKNNGIGTVNLAICYENGYGVVEDKAKALACYKKALKLDLKDPERVSSMKEKIELLEIDLGVNAEPSGLDITVVSAKSSSAYKATQAEGHG